MQEEEEESQHSDADSVESVKSKDSILSADTVMLDDARGRNLETKTKRTKRTQETKNKKRKAEDHDDDSLRGKYWAVVHEAQKRLKKAHPNKPAKEILKMARAECFDSTS